MFDGPDGADQQDRVTADGDEVSGFDQEHVGNRLGMFESGSDQLS